ncbi:Asp23/Gls24 family envelope stress response protein [Thermohalobacter berrensis]|uniref:ATPase AAA-type core domain-containing protein n=1 Tax=Thermohalobacter berrensis TaxID=99594 RepID=A0A419SV05_9FIRM|nr:Asp23/Gls24 family envelope stress response protein [Thermohalobacter berrensis]RKD29051.1 hypothetical protein BET03_06835 [Thermohalobacter berrensis]
MEIIALIGESGTGKSHKAIMIAKELDIEYIIDDGLLIKGTKVISGKSAKRESSIVAAVKRALFMDEGHKREVKNAIDKLNPDKILIIGTSNRMVEKISKALELPPISKKIYIEEISSDEEIKLAKKHRTKEGKHVIPVPTFEIKKDFSGYFLDKLKIFLGRKDKGKQVYEKTVVRPTFSYLGKYTISHTVVIDLVKFAAKKVKDIYKVGRIYINDREEGIVIEVDVSIRYGEPIIPIITELQRNIILEVEKMTSLNILNVNVYVKKLIK